MERWTGRVAIVTGASSGIGEAIARLLAEKGMKVVAAARRLDRLQVLSAETKGAIHAVQCDVTKEADVIRVVQFAREKLGGADVLVNNAGIASTALHLHNGSTEGMSKIIDTNVMGLSMFTREVVKDMRDRGINDGHIFHIGSVAGHSVPQFPGGGFYVYCASKHAVRVLTEGLRRELRDLGTKIRVTCISPGVVRTEIAVAGGMPQQFVDKFLSENPSLEPRDVAEALLYALATPPHVQVHDITIRPVGELL